MAVPSRDLMGAPVSGHMVEWLPPGRAFGTWAPLGGQREVGNVERPRVRIAERPARSRGRSRFPARSRLALLLRFLRNRLRNWPPRFNDWQKPFKIAETMRRKLIISRHPRKTPFAAVMRLEGAKRDATLTQMQEIAPNLIFGEQRRALGKRGRAPGCGSPPTAPSQAFAGAWAPRHRRCSLHGSDVSLRRYGIEGCF
jgi:hypothetical protein